VRRRTGRQTGCQSCSRFADRLESGFRAHDGAELRLRAADAAGGGLAVQAATEPVCVDGDVARGAVEDQIVGVRRLLCSLWSLLLPTSTPTRICRRRPSLSVSPCQTSRASVTARRAVAAPPAADAPPRSNRPATAAVRTWSPATRNSRSGTAPVRKGANARACRRRKQAKPAPQLVKVRQRHRGPRRGPRRRSRPTRSRRADCSSRRTRARGRVWLCGPSPASTREGSHPRRWRRPC